MRRLIVVLALAAVLTGAETAQACTCVYVPPKQQLEGADGAGIFRLLDVRKVSSAEVDLVYRVGRVYKGGPGLRRGRRIAIRRPAIDSCGVSQISAAQMRRLGEAASAAAATGCDGPAASS